MKSKDTISKGPKKRDPTCLRVERDIVIPKGTILRQQSGKQGTFSCPIGAEGEFSVTPTPDTVCGDYRKVVSA